MQLNYITFKKYELVKSVIHISVQYQFRNTSFYEKSIISRIYLIQLENERDIIQPLVAHNCNLQPDHEKRTHPLSLKPALRSLTEDDKNQLMGIQFNFLTSASDEGGYTIQLALFVRTGPALTNRGENGP